MRTCSLQGPGLDRTKYGEIQFIEVEFANQRHLVIDFDVLSGWVSFHHSEHWLLAELLKHVNLLTDEALEACGVGSLQRYILKHFKERNTQLIFEFPLRGKSKN